MIKSLSKKLLVSIGIVGILFNIFSSSVAAQNTTTPRWYAPTFGEFNSKVGDPNQQEIFGERYTQAQVYWIVYSLINFFISGTFSECVSQLSTTGADITNIEGEVTECSEQAASANPSGSMGPILDLAFFADNINSTRPASGIQYLTDKFDLVSEANAQETGFGFGTLSGTQNLWGAARNMAYGLMVLVVLVLAFGIMLRVKLNPQTVITIQSAIPRVVIALIAITFSFAIAGLMIDLSYLVQGIVASFIYASGIVKTTHESGAFTVVDFLTTMNNSSHGILSIGMLTIIVALIPALLIATVGGAILPGVGASVGFIGGTILLLLLMVVFLLGLIKLIWLFLRTYAVLLINIVFGPFIILMGAVNLGGGIMSWIKSIVAQLAVFVVASLLIVVAHIFIWGSNFLGNVNGNVLADGRVLNPFNIEAGSASLGSASLPGFSGFDPGTLGFMVALVIILSIPSIASFVRDQISKPSRLELGIGSAFGPVKSGGLWMAAEGMNRYTTAYQKKTGTTDTPAIVQAGRKQLGIKG